MWLIDSLDKMPVEVGRRNVIIFGETGAGKSSLVNMISEVEVAGTSSAASGCTFQSHPYEVDIAGKPFRLWDTAGLGEGDKGTATHKEAAQNLFKLICGLEDGLGLLVYCVRGPRIKEGTAKNYEMFHTVFCQGKVPIVLMMTGLEQEEPMKGWWPDNKDAFERHNMGFRGTACVTTTKGKKKHGQYVYEEEYQESRERSRDLILETCLDIPWKMEKKKWILAVFQAIYKFFSGMFQYVELVAKLGFSDEEAKAFASAATPKEEK